VGPGGDYANITAAIGALTASGVSGPVSFLVRANDVGPWTLAAFPGMGPSNPVLFDGQGTVTFTGGQPLLTLSGCDSVTFRGFNATLTNAAYGIVVAPGTTACVFTGCNFQAPTTTTGTTSVFNLTGGSRCRIEDSTFGGAWEALTSAAANDLTTVQRCRIISGGFRIMTISGSNFTLVDNFITGTANYGINAGAPGQATTGVNVKIRHNSVVITHPTPSNQYCSLRWYTNTATSEVVDNIFCDSFLAPTTTGFNLWCSLALRPAVMDYNCFWSNQAGYTPFFATVNQTLAGWQGLGFDLNSIQADPLFVAPATADLRLQTGSPCAIAGTALASVTTDIFQSLRTAPVSIGAHEESGGIGAAYAVFGGGCAGHAGVPSNGNVGTPAIGGSWQLSLGNLPPPDVAILVFGFSNTVSGLGPLPVALSSFGAPGCSARVSLDATSLLVGSGGTATSNFTTPGNPLLVGLRVFTQALVLDPGRNAMGAVTSDAATATVGL
jgi:hypothetical protein